ncbi:MAG: hypothetical protein ABI646_04625, partial [Acidobacteriota bacterium]
MKYLLLAVAAVSLAGCNRAAAPVANSPKPINVAQQTNEAQSVLAHSSEGQPPKPMNSNGAGPAKSSPTGDPIDTSKFDHAIELAEKGIKAKSDEPTKKLLAEAYFE